MDSVIAQIALPIVLALIMFGMGLSLSTRDFSRLIKFPKPILLGVLGQFIILPVLAFSVANLFGLSSNLAIGLMILAACPGGTMSNVASQLARANLALSVSLTAVSTVICVITTPLIIQFSINYFDDQSAQEFSLRSTVLGLIFITLVPVLLGLVCNEIWPKISARIEPFFRKLSVLFLVTMIAFIVYKDRDTLMTSFSQVFLSVICLNFIAIGAGFLLGIFGRCRPADTATLGIEVGIQNASLAILIAITFLGKPEFATAGGVYGVAMYLGAIPLILWNLHKQKTA